MHAECHHKENIVVRPLKWPYSFWSEYKKWPYSFWSEDKKSPYSFWSEYKKWPYSFWSEYMKWPHSFWSEYKKWPYSFLSEYKKRPYSFWSEYKKWPHSFLVLRGFLVSQNFEAFDVILRRVIFCCIGQPTRGSQELSTNKIEELWYTMTFCKHVLTCIFFLYWKKVLCNIGAYVISVSLTSNMENSMTFLKTCIILNILIFYLSWYLRWATWCICHSLVFTWTVDQ
jgi:hypothetical protein